MPESNWINNNPSRTLNEGIEKANNQLYFAEPPKASRITSTEYLWK